MKLLFSTMSTELSTTLAEDYKNLLPQVRLDIEMIKKSEQVNPETPKSTTVREIKNNSRDFFAHSTSNSKLITTD